MSTLWDRLPQVEMVYLVWAIAAAFKILSTNKRYHFAEIHAYGYRFDALAAMISSRIIGVPYSVHIKGPGLHLKQLLPSRIQRCLRSLEHPMNLLTLKRASLILCETEEGRRSLYPYIEKKTKIQLSPSPMPVRDYNLPGRIRETMREGLGLKKGTVVIGYVGRLSPEKNLETLVRAYTSARDLTKHPSKLLIIGSGPSEMGLKRLAANLQTDENVVFTGRRSDVPELLQALDVFVNPSFFEGSSNSLLEAIAAGKVAVTSNLPGNREILADEAGYLFDPHDVTSLERILVELINDHKMRDQKRLKAYRSAMRYDLDNVCEDFLSKLKGVAAENSSMRIYAPRRTESLLAAE
jgi:glycosyltransferase involved in cell wall biosynthesis